jgi:hypothetical protein
MEFNSTNLPAIVSKGLYEQLNYDVDAIHIEKFYYVLFYSVSTILREIKSKDHPVSYVFKDKKRNEIAAATVEYFDNERDNPGNWSLTWTFDPKDIPENAVKEDLLNPLFHPHFKAISGEKYGMMFTGDTALVNIMTFCIEQLYKWLDENAKKGEDVEINLDGVFKAVVQVENVNGEDQKIFAIIPAGEVKTMIKDDVSIEK